MTGGAAVGPPGAGGHGPGGGVAPPPPPPLPSGNPGRWSRLLRLLIALRDALSRSTRNLALYTSEERALREARQREGALASFGESPERDLGEGRSLGTGEASASEMRARRFVAEWQLGRPELLLAGRVLDLLIDALRAFGASHDRRFGDLVGELAPAVVVRPLPRLVRLTRRGLFPMRAVIVSRRPDLLRSILDFSEGHPGIGVDLIKGLAPTPQLRSRCMIEGGGWGTVAGTVGAATGPRFKLTCAHVAAPGCASAQPSTPPPRHGVEVTYEPDVVLLDAETRCFELGGLQSIKPASVTQIEKMTVDSARVHRVGGRKGGRGRLHGQVVGIPDPHGDGLCRFPSLIIDPRRRNWLLWDSPLRCKAFSSSGDSGSWVIDDLNGTWLGMIVSGGRDRSWAHEAGELLRWLEHQQSNRGEGWTSTCLTAS
jgi:hypothetical protein